MQVQLDYGAGSIPVVLPDDRTVVVTPTHQPAAADPLDIMRTALQRPVAGPPLRKLVRGGEKIAISVCDVTRPQPRALMLRAIIDELGEKTRLDDIVVLVATGTHRVSRSDELAAMLGPDLRSALSVVDHDSRDPSALVDLGVVDGDVPVRLNRHWVEADIRITTGLVEPHFFAGFSGGPKMVAPGLAALETVLALHNARRIGSPMATWGIRHGNPVHDAIRAAAMTAPPHYAVDVLLNEQQAVTHAFGGTLLEMHEAACAAARIGAMRHVSRRFELVVTTNGGYPLDQNLYQTVKGMCAAEAVVAQGGTILCAAECRDGLPAGSGYESLLSQAGSIADVNDRILGSPTTLPDQWQVQLQARVQARARVLVHAGGLTEQQLASAFLGHAGDLQQAVDEILERSPEGRVCVLPHGPQTIAYT